MSEILVVLVLVLIVLSGVYVLNVCLLNKLEYTRCASIGVSILLYLAIPHQLVVLNRLVFDIGLRHSLIGFLSASLLCTVAYFARNWQLVRADLLAVMSFVACKKIWIGILASIIIGYFIVGVSFKPSSIDELAYHVPQAAGALQADGLYRYSTGLPWVISYPQGAALVWSLFAWAGGSDVFIRVPQILYLVSLLFSVSAILSRLKISAELIFMACLAIVSMPVVYILATTNRADLAYAAYLVGMLSVVFSSGDRAKFVPLVLTLLFFASATVKLPVISAILFAVLGLAYLALKLKPAVRKSAANLNFASICASFIVLIFFCISFYVYVANFINYGNPLYPVNVSVLGKEIFSGPLKMDLASGHTTFGNIQEFSRLRIWQAVFFDWYSPLNEDSYGSSGVFVALLALPLSVICFFIAIFNMGRVESRWLLIMLCLCALPYLIPSLVLPRYHLFFSVILIIGCLRVLNMLSISDSRPVTAACLIFILPSMLVIASNLYDRYTWVFNNAGKFDRGASILTKYTMLEGMGPSPNAVAYLKGNAFQNIYYCGNMFPGLMWNASYNNNVVYIGNSNAGCNFEQVKRHGKYDVLLCDEGLCSEELIIEHATLFGQRRGATYIYKLEAVSSVDR